MNASGDLPRPRFARMYQRSPQNAERRGGTEHRRRLLEGLSGTVVELGAGHGLNFPHYPRTVTEVIAVVVGIWPGRETDFDVPVDKCRMGTGTQVRLGVLEAATRVQEIQRPREEKQTAAHTKPEASERVRSGRL